MARKPRTAAKPAAANEPAAAIQPAVETPFQDAGGAEGPSSDAAASPGGPEAKASDAGHAPDAADPAGTSGASAAQDAESRERTEATPSDQKGAAEGEKQPGDSAQPPVADQRVLVVTGPKRGRRRAGRTFGREAVRIPIAELGEDEIEAIFADEALACAIEEPADG